MILEGNERGYGAELARHLMNPRENDHVTLHLVDGFVADDLHGAFTEAEAISGGTKCRKYLFSLSLNPPPSESVSVDQFEDAVARIEKRLGLAGQPRTIVFHEKDGRRHAHVVWSRIDAETMTAINLSHYKRKLTDVSRELFLEHGWEMPAGLRRREDRSPDNTRRAESQQAKRLKRDRETTKAMFRRCWERSDSRAAFAAALHDEGYALAQGDRRGFVAVDADGKVWSLSRWCGVKPKEMRARLGSEHDLPSIEDITARLKDLPKARKQTPDPTFALKREELVGKQRQAREALLAAQEERRVSETKTRLPRGVRAAFLRVTRQWDRVVRQAEDAARASEQRDRVERQTLIDRHLAERRALSWEHAQQRSPRDPRQQLVVSNDELPFTARQLEQKPDLILTHLSKTKADFTRTDVLRALAERVDDPQALTALADKALQSPEAVRLPSDCVSRYTTRDFVKAEQSLARSASALAATKGVRVSDANTASAVKAQNAQMKRGFGGRLSEEQETALRHVLDSPQLAQVVGLAGAGKSTMLAAAADAWHRQGVTVHGAALAGKAADGLESASGIRSRTLASLEASWENGNHPIAKGDVLVVDEAGMIGTRQMARVTAKINEIGAKLVLVGDPDQLQPIEAGHPFRDLVTKHGAAELKEIYRQREEWQRNASRKLAEGQTSEALESYAQRNGVSKTEDRDAAIEALVETYAMDYGADSNKARLAFAHRRRDVHALNVAIRSALRDDDAPRETILNTATGPRAFAPGDRLVFGQNNKDLGVKNGMLGTVERVSDSRVRVMLDGEERSTVTFNPRQYQSFDHGYAVTIHKSQGATVDRSYVLASRTMDRHLAYVAMTRHREDLRVFVARDDQPSWARAHRPRHDRARDGPARSGPSMG